jgi:hypothetical protein
MRPPQLGRPQRAAPARRAGRPVEVCDADHFQLVETLPRPQSMRLSSPREIEGPWRYLDWLIADFPEIPLSKFR